MPEHSAARRPARLRWAGFDHQHVKHEGALRSAFQIMLADTARTHNWVLFPELATQAGGKRVVPDGTLRHQNSLPRGYWESKDTDDDLDTEITHANSTNHASLPCRIITPSRTADTKRAYFA